MKGTQRLAVAAIVALWAPMAPAEAAALDALFFDHRLGELERAAAAQLKDDDPTNDAQAHAWLSRAHFRQGRLTGAESALASAGRDSLPGLLAHGDYALFSGDFAAALAHFERARDRSPDDVHALWGLASALLSLERYEEAERAAARAHTLARQLPPGVRAHVLTVYGGALALKAQRGFLDKVTAGPRARQLLEQAVALDPRNAYARYALGRFYLEAPAFYGGGPEAAVRELKRSVELNPHYYMAHAFLIRALREAKRDQQAAEELQAYRRKFGDRRKALQELQNISS